MAEQETKGKEMAKKEMDEKEMNEKEIAEKEISEKAANEESTDHINPGDKEAPPSASVEEKQEQVAVSYDEFGSEVVIPTYFAVEDQETGEKKALHHVKDAEEISDVIRQARVNEDGERTWR